MFSPDLVIGMKTDVAEPPVIYKVRFLAGGQITRIDCYEYYDNGLSEFRDSEEFKTLFDL